MIDDEIEQAKEYAEKWQPKDGQAQRYIIQGYIAGSRSKEERIKKLERENAELKARIEKMKCCGNCIGNCNSDDMVRFCKDNNYKLWEIKGNEIQG